MVDEQNLIHFLKQDAELMQHLHTVARLDLPDWWICAGYIRAKVWTTFMDTKHRLRRMMWM